MNRYLLVLAYILISSTGFGQTRELPRYIKADTILVDYGRKKINQINLSNIHIRSRVFFYGRKIHSLANFINAEFHSLANFGRAEFDSLVNFNGARFYSKANFGEAEFDYLTNFNQTKFHSEANFSYADFDSLTDFNRARFHSKTNFGSAKFHSLADFKSVKFHSEANFRGVEFASQAYFNKTKFDSLTDFRGAGFASQAYFGETKFEALANFYLTKFKSLVTFERAEFDTLANFRTAKFNSVVDFSKAKFNDLNLDRCWLPKRMNFSEISTNEIIDLTTSRLGDHNSKCYINLIDAPIEKFKMRYDKFRVDVPDSITVDTYEKLTNVYEGLLKNFRDYGYLTSYETLDKEYQEFKFTKNPNGTFAGILLNWLNKNWNDYGYNKVRIWYITLLFFMIFTFINWIRLPQLITNVYTIPVIKEVLAENKKLKKYKAKHNTYPVLNFRTPLLAVYYTGLIFFGFKLSIENFNFRYPVSVFFIFLQYLIGLICIAYLANFVISSTLIGS